VEIQAGKNEHLTERNGGMVVQWYDFIVANYCKKKKKVYSYTIVTILLIILTESKNEMNILLRYYRRDKPEC